MIPGLVSPGRAPLLSLRVLGMAGAEEVVTATVDTGFTGYLTLPATVIARLGLLYTRTRMTTLADGRTVPIRVYAGAVDWHGQPRGVLVAATASEPLVGMTLLEDSELWLDCQPGGAVEITQTLPPPAPAP